MVRIRLNQPIAWLILVVLLIVATLVWNPAIMFLTAFGAWLCFK